MSRDTPSSEGAPRPESLAAALERKGMVSAANLRRVQTAAQDMGVRFDQALLELGLIDSEQLAAFYADWLAVPLIRAADLPAAPVLPEALTLAFLRRENLLPVAEDGDGVLLAMADPSDADLVAAVSFELERAVRPAAIAPETLKLAFLSLYEIAAAASAPEQAESLADSESERLRALASDGPAVRYVAEALADAAARKATDIHIEAGADGGRIRFRIDGVLADYAKHPTAFSAAVASRIKVMANLDITERRLPQDGRFRAAVRGREIDFRVATLPSQFGETIVLRLLDRSRVDLTWDGLGYDPAARDAFLRMLSAPDGVVLVCGPTGSGKTTTLYTALRGLATPERKVMTVEDPIEYAAPGLTQIQVHPQIGLDFARVLRASLRHDPDVLLVGEIRDSETAEIAVRAALTGKLVLSTLHTNSSLGAIPRLRDLGVEDYLIAATLRGALSQRLLRRLCACRSPDPSERCETCHGAGYDGRVVIAESLVLNDDFRDLIARGAALADLENYARHIGHETLSEAAKSAIAAHETDVEEVARVLGVSQR